MSVFAIGDLHMSTVQKKTMDQFGWFHHVDRILEDWNNKITEDDIVLLVGDISWALRLEEVEPDIKILSKLPGHKFMIRGNHDYWWSSVSKMSKKFPRIHFLHNNHFVIGDYVIFGTRGWICPNDTQFTETDEKIYERELKRLKNSVNSASETVIQNKKKLLMLHYPPMNDKKEPSGFTDIIEEAKIDVVCYGHLHGEEFHKMGFEGIKNHTEYHLVSCDYLDFKVKKILDG